MQRSSDDVARVLADAAANGMHRISLPTPFSVGAVHCYLIEDDPLTLIDCGPNMATSLRDLQAGVRALGHDLDEVQLAVVTHQHLDHAGLAHALADRGAEVVSHARLAPLFPEWHHFAQQDDDDARLLMQRHGVEEHVSEALHAVSAIVQGYGASVTEVRGLADGEELQLSGRRLVVHYRPGHSPSDIVLHDAAARILLGGDHLLAGISSNAVVARPLDPDWDGRRPQPLLDYRQSLRATAELDVDLVLGGHAEPVTGHRELVVQRLAAQERRAHRFLDALSERPLTAHEIAVRTWGDVAVTQAYLTLSEVLGHLDLLVEQGVVVEDRSAHTIRFERL